MKHRLILSILMLLLALQVAAQVNGELQVMGDKKILKVWGDHYQRGYAQGYMLADEVMEVFHDYFFTMQVFSDPVYYASLRDYYSQNFSPDCRFVSEAAGLITGVTNALGSGYFEPLDRNLDPLDILLLNASVDLAYLAGKTELSLGCATLASWGIATASDEILQGSAVITRFLDWTQNSALIAHPLMVVHYPSEEDEQKWINFTYPGFFGAISAISESRSAAFMNSGNIHTLVDAQNLNPILFSIRDGIEKADYNNSGTYDADDLFGSLSSARHLAGFIVQNLWESGDYFHSSVIETNNVSTLRRLPHQNGDLPSGHQAATNHFRMLGGAICCNRYYLVQDSLYTNPYVSPKRQWTVLAGAAGMENNLMAIQYIPSLDYLLWSTATTSTPAYERAGVTLDLSQYFNYSVDNSQTNAPIAANHLSIYPNPHRQISDLKVDSDKMITRLELFNSRGQLLFRDEPLTMAYTFGAKANGLSLPSGIYFIRASFADGTRQQRRILNLR